MSTGASTPAAIACAPLGFTTSQAVMLVWPFSACNALLSALRPSLPRSKLCILSTLPEVDGGRLGLPYAGGLDTGQVHKRPVFGAEGDEVVGLRHYGRLAGDGVAHHPESVLGADNEGEEPVEVGQRRLQRLAERLALLQLVADEGGGDLGVVLGLERHAEALQFAPHAVVVGKRAVMDKALVRPGGEWMRPHRRHRGFRRHAGVPDSVRSLHLR